MAGKKKLEHFAEMKLFPHVFEPELDEVFRTNYKMKGNWRKDFFKNDNPLVVEFGCGKGEYSVGMGRKFPNKNFIGVDIKGARMWRGAKTAEEENLKNIAFLRTRIEFIEGCFAKNEITNFASYNGSCSNYILDYGDHNDRLDSRLGDYFNRIL